MTEILTKGRILIVDDMAENLEILGSILSPTYQVQVAMNGIDALKIATNTPYPDLILLDIMMPEIDGFEVCRQLKLNVNTLAIPVIFVTAKGDIHDETEGFKLGAVDYITKPLKPVLVEARVRTHLALYNQQLCLEELVGKRTEKLEITRMQIIQRLGRAAEYRDNETGMHVIRMSYYSQLLALKAGLSKKEADLILAAAPMHDIGKIGIPDCILLKQGKLDKDEMKIMMTHPAIGAKIIGNDDSCLLQLAKTVAMTHHEKWNGKGYPRGLKGEQIPLAGRILAIADVFDALTSVRPYKDAWPVEKAFKLISEEAGEHFDPKLVPFFLELEPEILQILNQFADKED